jgi:hypothetical protein
VRSRRGNDPGVGEVLVDYEAGQRIVVADKGLLDVDPVGHKLVVGLTGSLGFVRALLSLIFHQIFLELLGEVQNHVESVLIRDDDKHKDMRVLAILENAQATAKHSIELKMGLVNQLFDLVSLVLS